MNRKMMLRLSLDFTMTALMLLEMAYQLTGNLAHELIGMTMFALFIVHNLLNRSWYGSIFKGRRTVHQILSIATNLLFLVVMLLLMITGILISRDLFAFLGINGGFIVRQLHTIAANWGLILVSVHLGLHWAMIMGTIRKMAGITAQSSARTITIRLLTALIVIFGVKSSYDLGIGSKLAMYFTFSYWDFEKTAAAFFAAYLSVMGIYTAAAYYGCKLLKKRGKATNQKTESEEQGIMSFSDAKCLIAYFSRKGNNYVSGKIVNLPVGNTEVAAQMIREMTGGDLFRIEAVSAYPEDYTETTEVAQRELRAGVRPELTDHLKIMASYDMILIGYPNWWGTMPMPVFTFLEEYDFSKKTIVPFCTHEGSGLGHSEKDIARLCPKAALLTGLAIRGNCVKDAKKDIANWLDKVSAAF